MLRRGQLNIRHEITESSANFLCDKCIEASEVTLTTHFVNLFIIALIWFYSASLNQKTIVELKSFQYLIHILYQQVQRFLWKLMKMWHEENFAGDLMTFIYVTPPPPPPPNVLTSYLNFQWLLYTGK